jgi:hypothetical protein
LDNELVRFLEFYRDGFQDHLAEVLGSFSMEAQEQTLCPALDMILGEGGAGEQLNVRNLAAFVDAFRRHNQGNCHEPCASL